MVSIFKVSPAPCLACQCELLGMNRAARSCPWRPAHSRVVQRPCSLARSILRDFLHWNPPGYFHHRSLIFRRLFCQPEEEEELQKEEPHQKLLCSVASERTWIFPANSPGYLPLWASRCHCLCLYRLCPELGSSLPSAALRRTWPSPGRTKKVTVMH
jgi:hypothetical protein